MENQQTKSVKCWKCGAVNRAATEICFSCDAFLNLSTAQRDAPGYALNGGDFFSSPLVKVLSVFFVFFLAVILGFTLLKNSPEINFSSWIPDFSSKNRPQPSPSPGETAKAAATPKASDSPNEPKPRGWYEETWRSWIFRYPEPKAIFVKNVEATGNIVLQKDLQSLQMRGSFSAAQSSNMTETDIKSLSFAPVGNVTIQQKKPYKVFVEIGFARSVKESEFGIKSNSLTPTAPNMIQVQINLKQGFNGFLGWRNQVTKHKDAVLENKIEDIQGKELAELEANSLLGWNDYAKAFRKPEVKNILEVGGNPCYVVKALRNDETGEKFTLYFDTVTGLLLRLDKSDGAIFFENYRDVKGMKLPHTFIARQSVAYDDVWMRMDIAEIIVNGEIEDALFEKPKE